MAQQKIFQLNCSSAVLKPVQFCAGNSHGNDKVQHEMTSLVFLYFITEGNGEVHTKRAGHVFEQGDIICIFPENICDLVFHGMKNRWYWISLEAGRPGELHWQKALREEMTVLKGGITPKIAGILSELEQRQDALQQISYRILGILYLLLDELYTGADDAEVQRLRGKESQSVAAAVEYVKLNYYHKIDVDAVCRYVNYSRYYFSRCFKEMQGMSILEYINKVRMERAAYLLGHTELTVTEVAKSVGFDDPFYFSKRFKAYAGMPPSRLKERQERGGICT